MNFWNALKLKLTIIKDLGYLGSANIIGTGISAFFWFYLANLLGAEDYGEIQYYIGIAGIAYFASLFATSNSIVVLVAKNVKIHSTLFLISIVTSFVSLLVLISLFQQVDIGLLVIGYVINELGLSYLLGKKLYSKYSINLIIQKILTLVFGLSFFYFFGPDGIIFGLALTYIHFIIILFRGYKESKISFSSLKPHSGFIINNYLENLVNGLRANIATIIIAPLVGFSILGNYALAMQFFGVLIIPSEVVLKYIIPKDASGESNQKLKKITILVSVGIAVFGATVMPLIIPYFFPKYEDAIVAIQIISISAVPTTIGYFLISKLLSLEKSKPILFARLISMSIIVVFLIILSKPLGITGISIAFILSTSSQTIFLCVIYKQIMNKK